MHIVKERVLAHRKAQILDNLALEDVVGGNGQSSAPPSKIGRSFKITGISDLDFEYDE